MKNSLCDLNRGVNYSYSVRDKRKTAGENRCNPKRLGIIYQESFKIQEHGELFFQHQKGMGVPCTTNGDGMCLVKVLHERMDVGRGQEAE
jgi:hypothetical protein